MSADPPDSVPSARALQRSAARRGFVQGAQAIGAGLGVLALALGLGLLLQAIGSWDGLGVGASLLCGAFLGGGLGAVLLRRSSRERRLELARALTLAGHGAEALPLLKALSGGRPAASVKDTLCYLTARAYEAQGAVKLALAYYRDYRKRYPEGTWALEAKTHAAELRRLERERKKLTVAALPEVALRCPYCREDLELGKEALSECASCGTRAHSDCAAEHGGCVVFGCEQAAALPSQRA